MLSVLLMLGCTPELPLEQGDAALRLAYSNNLDGETEPCG
ncbi:MAG: hypothetical protein ACI8S6_005051 [Myxococcota bacterium]|jgi:hypothetical protein